jgi:hypothetical protein
MYACIRQIGRGFLAGVRRRRDEWIEAGVLEQLRGLALTAYDRTVGLRLSDVAVDCCVTKAPCGGEKAGRSPVDRGKRGTSSARWWWTQTASLWAPSRRRQTVTTLRSWLRRWKLCGNSEGCPSR